MGSTTNTVRDHNSETQSIGTHGKVNATYLVNQTEYINNLTNHTYE